jgi:GAF domain-containing protein
MKRKEEIGMDSSTPQFQNTYHNQWTLPKQTESPEMRTFHDAAERVLGMAADLARIVTKAHQGAATQLIKGDWSQARKYFSLSEKYSKWADYRTSPVGFGIHTLPVQSNESLRLTQSQLEAHPAWKDFGVEHDKHPPLRGWLAVPLVGADGLNYGLIQTSDPYEGDFTEEDEANLKRVAKLTATALDALAMLYFPDYRARIEAAQRTTSTD